MPSRRTPAIYSLLVLTCGALLATAGGLAAASPTFVDDFTDVDGTKSKENVALVRQCPRVPPEPDVRIDKGEQGHHPYAIKLVNGEMLCAVFRAPTHDPHGTVRYSTDNGRTWSDKISPLPKPNGLYSRLVQTPDGRVWFGGTWVKWHHTYLPGTKGPLEQYAVYSDDNGRTWSKVNTPRPGVGPEIVLSNGDFLWIKHGRFPPSEEVRKSLPNTRNIQGLRSQRGLCLFKGIDEDGKVKLSESFLYPQLGNPDEWDVVETGSPGRLVAILRQQETGDYYYTGISTDYGRTFESRPAPIWHSSTQQRARIITMDDGTLVVVYGERDNSLRMMAIASLDHGETWQTHRKLVICDWLDYDDLEQEFLYSPERRVEMDRDHGYPSACQSGPHELMGLWSTVHFPGEVYGTFLDTRFFKDVYGGMSLAHTGLPLDERCIAHWSFDEEGKIANDPARYNYGHIVGPQRVRGKFGRGLRFDGQDDFVMVPDNDMLRVPTFYTLEAWINTDDASRDQTILDKTFGEAVEFVPYRLELHNGRLRFTTGVDSFGGEQTLESNQWYHIAVRVWPAGQSSQISFYVNGELDGPVQPLQGTNGPDAYFNALRRIDRRVDSQPLYVSYSLPRDQRFHALTIGISKDYSSRPFAGMIDEVAIYAEALTEKEIRRNATRRYVRYGRIVSRVIRLREGEKWGAFTADVDAPEGSSISFTVLNVDVPELNRKIAPGADLSSLAAKTIHLSAQLRSADGTQTPVLKSWGVR